MAHDVFISYSNKDKTIADAVCARLEEKKIRCWIAPRDIPAGKNFAESIIKAINTCHVFVLVWSSHTNTSEHILNEINQAFDKGVTIIPFRIEDVQPTDAMRYYFGRTHWLDAITLPLEKHIANLADLINANLGITPESNPEPEPVQVETTREEPKPKESKLEEKPQTKAPIQAVIKKEKSREARPESTVPEKRISPLLFVGGALVLVLIALQFSGVFKSPASSKDSKISEPTAPSTLAAAASGSTPTQDGSAATPQNAEPTVNPTKPAATATASAPWVSNFAEPILSAIKGQEPDFQDDFSTTKPDWQIGEPVPECPNTRVSITGGKLHINAEPKCIGQGTSIGGPSLPKNFVLQVDAFSSDYFQISPGVILNTLNESGMYFFQLFDSLKTNWRLSYNGPEAEGVVDLPTGYSKFDKDIYVTITIIVKENACAISLNGIPITYVNNLYKAPINGLILWASGPSGKPNWGAGTADFDNLKVWDLDKIK